MQWHMRTEVNFPGKALSVVVSLSAITVLALYGIPSSALSWNLIALLAVISAIVVMLYAAFASRDTERRRRVAFLFWWVLLASEEMLSIRNFHLMRIRKPLSG
jgi:heme/copper-type cytochrome/quinol oxidase subunit 4